MKKRPYYEAYDKRYRIAHEKGICWLGEEPSAIVLQALERWAVPRESSILELGCGEGRDAFYRFVAAHLTEGGVGLICSMGNGTTQRQTDPTEAFRMRYRDYGEEKIRLPATSCRMVSFPVFRDELRRNGLLRLEEGMTAVSGFSDMMYAVVGRANR